MVLPIIAMPFIYIGVSAAIWVTGEAGVSLYKRSNAYIYFNKYLNKNLNLQKNIENLINSYTSKRVVKIDIKAFYGALYILFFTKPEKTRRLKGSVCDYSIAYMIKEYLKNPNDENKNNLLKKMGQYNKSGSLLKKEKDGIRIISLLIVLLNLSPTFLDGDKETFYIKLPTKDNLIGPYNNEYI